MAMRNIASLPFALAAGTANTNQNLEAYDLSRARAVEMVVDLTGVGAAEAGDTLDIYLQEADDDVTPTWDDRIHMPQFIGSMTVSAAAPERRIVRFTCFGAAVSTSDSSYEPSGSAGAAHIAAGAWITGPLKGRRRTSLGSQARHRFRFEQVDANANAAFAGTVNLWIDSDV